VWGFVTHGNGDPFPGVAVGVWSDAWQGQTTTSEASGKYELNLSNLPPGKFYVAIVRLETCGMRDGQPTAVDCQRRSLPIDFAITDICAGSGANKVTQVNFTGP
jgi:hypothetical protein